MMTKSSLICAWNSTEIYQELKMQCFTDVSFTLLQNLCFLWQQLQHIFFLTSQIFFNLITIILLQQRQQRQLSMISVLWKWVESDVIMLRTIQIDVRTNEFSLLLCWLDINVSSFMCWCLLSIVKTDWAEHFLLQASSHWLYRKISMLC